MNLYNATIFLSGYDYLEFIQKINASEKVLKGVKYRVNGCMSSIFVVWDFNSTHLGYYNQYDSFEHLFSRYNKDYFNLYKKSNVYRKDETLAELYPEEFL